MINRAVMAIPFLALAVMACAVQIADQRAVPPTPSASPVVSSTEIVRIDIISVQPSKITHITASQSVRLRTLPDASGPVDSVELAILRPGDEFSVSSCSQVAGQWWAYGEINGMKGWVSADYLTPNPCQ